MERFQDRIREGKGGNQQPPEQSKGGCVDQDRAPPVDSAAGQGSTAAGQVRACFFRQQTSSLASSAECIVG